MSLIVSNVTKKYGKTLACDNVSFDIPDSSLTVLLGPNGAGKSTIMKSIIGFLRYEGDISVDGIYNKNPAAHKILGYVPELPELYPNLTVNEHLELVARAWKLKDYKDYKNELLERFELSDKTKKFGDELSKGMQQKLNLCIGLLPKPKILLLDEPMIGLDPHAIKELKSLFNELRDNGASILISTHIIDSIDMIWDKTVIMQKGQVKAQIERNELENSGKTLEQIFFEVTENSGEQEI